MISIVLPVYNGEEYIEEALKSILNQSYRDLELIVVNDCSTDGTMEIVRKYQNSDVRVKVINNIENQKLPKSLNVGFEACRGDFFTWTSDDNILDEKMLERLLEELIDNEADLVFGRSRVIDGHGKELRTSKIVSDLDTIYSKNIIGACFLYKSNIHRELNGYNPDMFLVEDYDFWLRAYRKFKFFYVPEILYTYRMHDNNLSSQRMEEVRLRRIEMLNQNLDYTDRTEIKDAIIREISNSYFELSNVYYDKIRSKGYRKKVVIRRIKDSIMKSLRR